MNSGKHNAIIALFIALLLHLFLLAGLSFLWPTHPKKPPPLTITYKASPQALMKDTDYEEINKPLAAVSITSQPLATFKKTASILTPQPQFKQTPRPSAKLKNTPKPIPTIQPLVKRKFFPKTVSLKTAPQKTTIQTVEDSIVKPRLILNHTLKFTPLPKTDIKHPNSISTPKEQQQPLEAMADREEETVNLNTSKKHYAGYFSKVKERVEQKWNYPNQAKLKKLSGSIKLVFTIGKSGQLLAIKVVKSTGSKLLDTNAMDAVKDAGPFPPFPKDWKLKKLHIRAIFEYIHRGIKG